MKHEQVIENFVKEGKGRTGSYMRATDDVLYSSIPPRFLRNGPVSGTKAPLAVRLKDGSLLTNGAAFGWPTSGHQRQVLRSLERANARFGVVPYHSIVAAWTDGKADDWDKDPIPFRDLRKEVAIVVPSEGERWKEVEVTDKYGRKMTTQIHTLGDSVVRVKDRFYLSAVDETGSAFRGMYFFAELATDRAPESLQDAFNALKPPAVREAETQGLHVRRQGEWFAVPTMLRTSELMRDVERGIATYVSRHVLGRDGHHQLEEAVIYKAGERKGQVFARGVLTHTKGEHVNLDLGTIRWHQIIHNVQGASYTLSGRGTAQFD